MTSVNDFFLQAPGYTPETLLDYVSNFMKLRNDAQLARALGVAPPVISKIRSRTHAITHRLLIHIHDATGLSLEDIRNIGGIPKSNLNPKKKEAEDV